ncbi:restriction endonuclease subunit S [Arthrobacter sp. MSA 4-2]|uniref:restriction endonuclease subunit S n=1 Tax=Arthrobacter sp. MSA 4-2 TaxID=2794349 RepID=UPI0018E6EF2D|nr:restriction endonuclease subunit S [Arthrobacter sp. MSA 4-2]MBJ2119405.1 restriction endonuclease subunit S [Arthrobacter sp. MSA 4-2]
MTRSRLPLGEALEVLIDHRGKTPKKLGGDWSPTGYRVISALNIKNSVVDTNEHRFISHEMYEKWMNVKLRKGDVLLTSEAPTGEVAFLGDDFEWALGQRVFGLRGKPGVLDGRYLFYALRGGKLRHDIMSRTTGTTVQGIRQAELVKVQIELPPLPVQRAIAATLGALDDKIESNSRQRELLRSLGRARYLEAVELGAWTMPLASLSRSIARGVAPKYADEDSMAPLVVNQKCIRDGWVSLAPARRMHDKVVPPHKRATAGDILVNSTGTGTLGRLARWHEGEVFVDGHVSVVKADPGAVPPTVLAYALLHRQDDIEELATGSTGQTELSPTRLGSLRVTLPSALHSAELEPTLLSLEARAERLATETSRIEAIRKALLPELLSGRLRVPDEEAA